MKEYDYSALMSMSVNDLSHHGIKGQKWGQKNGPTYPLDSSDHSAAEKKAAGGSSGSGSDSSSSKTSLKDRIFKKSSGSSSKSSSDEKKEEKKEDESTKKTNTKKAVKDMSDSELSSAIKRLENEKKYAELTSKSSEKKKTSLGGQIVKDVTKNIATQTLSNIGSQTATYVLGVEINKLLKKYNASNGIDDDNSINPKKGQKDK